jgi:D-methionine transport system substrate-binding protein
MKKNIVPALLLIFTLFAAAAIAGALPADAAAAATMKIGATAGPQAQILEAAKAVLAREGIDLQIIEFNDYATPNAALDQGDLDANSFQHKPFLDAQIKARGFELTPIGTTVILPMGLYSKRISNLAELKDGATVAIPNDPSNGGRGLLLMQKFGLIKLKPEAGILPSPFDIAENPKGLKIVEVEAAQAPRVLDDVDLVAVNTNYALNVGLVPTRDSIALEDKDSPYACVIVVRTKDRGRPEFQKLVKAYQSPEVAQFIEDTFKGSIVKAW